MGGAGNAEYGNIRNIVTHKKNIGKHMKLQEHIEHVGTYGNILKNMKTLYIYIYIDNLLKYM